MSAIGVVLLAAGGSGRMGTPKQLLPFGGKPLVRHCAEVALAAFQPLIAVVGASAVEVEAALAGLPVQVVHNVLWERGVGTSIQAGVSRAEELGLEGVGPAGDQIPHYLYMCYQGTFAIITAALISGAIVERMRFSAYVVFITLWSIVVYSPVAHWVWGGGWLMQMGALDFAGGTVVHVNAGVAAVVAAKVVGPPRD